MAILSGGILGTVSGKVSGVVAGRWKDKNYVRQYAIPANPNTVPQQTQRNKFGLCVAFGKQILGQILNVYVDPFQKSMTGFNWFIKQNIALFTAPFNYHEVKISTGKLYLGQDIEDEFTATSAAATLPFSTDVGANGADTDKVYAAVYDADVGLFSFAAVAVNRSVGTITVPKPSEATWTVDSEAYGYLIAAKYDTNGIIKMVSSSIGHSINMSGI